PRRKRGDKAEITLDEKCGDASNEDSIRCAIDTNDGTGHATRTIMLAGLNLVLVGDQINQNEVGLDIRAFLPIVERPAEPLSTNLSQLRVIANNIYTGEIA